MIDTQSLCVGIAVLVPLFAALFSFIYGLKHFFKKGKPLFLQTITMAMGSHALGSIYHLCQSLTSDIRIEGFTPAYLGHMGFFLFFLTASFGQMDRIVDDGSAAMKPSRWIASLAPLGTALLYISFAISQGGALQTKVVYGFVWVPAAVAVYFHLKHAMIPDMDFGFIKAIKPYNILALCLCFSELIYLIAWSYSNMVVLGISATVFGVLCICTMVAAKKGSDKWTI